MCQWVKCADELPPHGWAGTVAYHYHDSPNQGMMQVEAEYQTSIDHPPGLFEIGYQSFRPVIEVFCWLKLPDLPPIDNKDLPGIQEPEPPPGLEHQLWHQQQLNKSLIRERDRLKTDYQDLISVGNGLRRQIADLTEEYEKLERKYTRLKKRFKAVVTSVN